MIREIGPDELNKTKNGVIIAVTTMCGTCTSALKMAEVALTALSVPVYQINVNLYPAVITDYQITSVPCFIVLRDGLVREQFYAFNSAVYLYEKLKTLFV